MPQTHNQNVLPPKAAKILLVIAHMGKGGSQRVMSVLANSWSQEGISVEIITLYDREIAFDLHKNITLITAWKTLPPILEKLSSLPIKYIDVFLRRFNDLRRIISLRKTIKSSGSTVVLSFLGKTNILTIIAAWGIGKKVIISERNDPEKQLLDNEFEFLRQKLYRFADIVTVNSKPALKTLKKYVPPEKLIYLPNPVIIDKNHLPTHRRNKSFLVVSRLVQQKRINLIIEAYALFSQQNPDWTLIILGSGNQEIALKNLAKELKIAPQIKWQGWQSPEKFYKNEGIFLLASKHEGTSNSMLEAMVHGMPIICTQNLAQGTDLFEPKFNNIADTTAKDFCRIMLEFSANVSLREQLGENLFSKSACFSIERIRNQWDDLLL